MTHALKIRKGDTVHILAGKDRGKEGRVIDAMPKDRKVLVENLNLVKRHTKPRPLKDSSRMGGTQIAPGGIIEKASPIHIGNVMLVCPTCNRPTRVGTVVKEVKGERQKVRVCRRADCGQEIDK
jgi:large subunit ribosomal protein L24